MSDVVELVGTTVDVVEITSAALDVVEVTTERIDVVELSGQQGPSGPQGPAGPAGGEAYYTAATDLGGHRAVRMTSDGLGYADCTDATHAGTVAGVTPCASSAGTSTTLVRYGEMVEPSWSWTPDAPVFVGLDGVLTQTLPGSAEFSLIIGVATSATSLFVRLREPVLLGA